MKNFFYISDNCRYLYDKQKNSLIFRINYTKRIGTNNSGDKYRIVSISKILPFILDKKVDLRFNMVIAKTRWEGYLEEVKSFNKLYGKVVHEDFNLKCILIDHEYLDFIINPNISKSKWLKSNTGKSMTISCIREEYGILPFSKYLRVFFALFIQGITMKDDDYYEFFEKDEVPFEAF